MKEKILKDIGDTVVIPDVYDETKEMTGVISMITVNKKGIQYRANFNGNSIKKRNFQHNFWQEEIKR